MLISFPLLASCQCCHAVPTTRPSSISSPPPHARVCPTATLDRLLHGAPPPALSSHAAPPSCLATAAAITPVHRCWPFPMREPLVCSGLLPLPCARAHSDSATIISPPSWAHTNPLIPRSAAPPCTPWFLPCPMPHVSTPPLPYHRTRKRARRSCASRPPLPALSCACMSSSVHARPMAP